MYWVLRILPKPLFRKNMALWQFHLKAIPKQSFLNIKGEDDPHFFKNLAEWQTYWAVYKPHKPPFRIGFADEDTRDWWGSSTIKAIEVELKMDELNISKRTYSDYISWKGDTENKQDHDAYILIEEATGFLKRFHFRIDSRDRQPLFLKKVLQICTDYDLLVIAPNDYFLAPELDLVVHFLFRFAPVEVLAEYQEGFLKS